MFNMELLQDKPDWPVDSSTNSVTDTNRSSAARKKAINNFNFNDGSNFDEEAKSMSSNSKSVFSSKRNSDSYNFDNQSRRVSKQNKEVSLCNKS